MRDIKERLEDFKNMISVVDNIYVTTLNSDYQVLETNCPNQNFLAVIFALGCEEQVGDLFMERLDAMDRCAKKIMLFTNRLGLTWISEVEEQNGETDYIHILGPVFLDEYSVKKIEASMERQRISLPIRRAFKEELSKIPVISISKFYEFGMMFHYCITGEKIRRNEIVIPTDDYVDSIKYVEKEREDEMEQEYLYEQKRLRLISEGNLNFRNELEKLSMPGRWNDYGSNELLRQMKNTVTINTALCTRAAICGGLSAAMAFGLSDLYLKQIEEATDIGMIAQINETMMNDFVKRVHTLKIQSGISPQIQKSCDYISLHLNEKLEVHKLAADLGYTDYYYSKKFKREVGIGVKEYIASQKVKLAKKMLKTTSMGINEIAEELSYVNQSYFGEIFKRDTGMSPSEYRQRKADV